MLFASPSKACYVNKGAPGGCAGERLHAVVQFGFIGGFDYGSVNTSVPGADAATPARTGSLKAISFLAGAVGRLSDTVSINGSKMPIGLGVYLGPTFRYWGSECDPSALFGSSHQAFAGVELGAFFRLASADVTARLTWTGPEDTSNSVQGLTGLGGLIRVTFALPFSIVKSDPQSPANAGKPAVGEQDEEQDASQDSEGDQAETDRKAAIDRAAIEQKAAVDKVAVDHKAAIDAVAVEQKAAIERKAAVERKAAGAAAPEAVAPAGAKPNP